MKPYIKLYSDKENEIFNFLNLFYNNFNSLKNINTKTLEYEIVYDNPIEIADIIGTFIENTEKFKINLWLCLDEDVLINITDSNVDDIIRYIYERYPY